MSSPDTPGMAIITPSYRGDFEHAVELCASIDRHVTRPFEHVLVVPRRDLALFGPLATSDRRVISDDDLLKPMGFHRLPLPTRIKLPPLIDFKMREQWLGPHFQRVNGWLIQQVVKLSAPQFTKSELLVFIDSDVVLIRKVELDDFMQSSDVVLHEHQGGRDLETHQGWRRNARKLLGLPEPAQDTWRNYIGNLIAWRRSNVVSLQHRLAEISGGPWQTAIAKMKGVSEYILYGVYAREVLGADSGHTYRDAKRSLSVWGGAGGSAPDAISAQLEDHHVCLHLQSTLPISLGERRAIMEQVLRVRGND